MAAGAAGGAIPSRDVNRPLSRRSRRSRWSRRTVAAVVVVLAATAAGCAAPERPLVTDADVDGVVLGPAATVPVEAPASTTAAAPEMPFEVPEEDLVELSFVASATGDGVDLHTEPGGEPYDRLANPIPSGDELVFLVEEFRGEWMRVLLPVRPNGSTGWIRSDEVVITYHNYRILVELEAFRLTVFDAGEELLSFEVGVAADNTPTPGGRYYLTELLAPVEPDSPYGDYAYGLSGYSEVLEEFAGGPGQLGIHGTNDPSSIGTKVSNGCIRLRNDDIGRLVEFLPVGVPVEIV
jgi:lipoprotein-anchoring transpeptidase ErfK/SrfK